MSRHAQSEVPRVLPRTSLLDPLGRRDFAQRYHLGNCRKDPTTYNKATCHPLQVPKRPNQIASWRQDRKCELGVDPTPPFHPGPPGRTVTLERGNGIDRNDLRHDQSRMGFPKQCLIDTSARYVYCGSDLDARLDLTGPVLAWWCR